MRTINKTDLGEKLNFLLDEKNPIDEDITIVNEKGTVLAAVISSEAYQFFIRKVEEEENKIDNETANDFHKSGEMDNEN